jgi:Zn-dependent protease
LYHKRVYNVHIKPPGEKIRMFQLHAPTLADLMWLPGLIIGFTVHELGHALVAYWMGDRGELTRERMTLNPIKHVSWLGLLAFVILGIGWAKPVRLRPGAFKHTNLGSLLVSLAGVTANALLAGVFLVIILVAGLAGAFVARQVGVSPRAVINILSAGRSLTPFGMIIAGFTGSVVNVNIALAMFNLLPIPGFDGFHALLSLFRLVTRRQMANQERQQAQAVVAFEEGNYHARAGRPAQAVEAWRQAARQHPSFYGALYNLGLAYAQAGQRSPALDALADARLAAQTEEDRQRVNTLLQQVGWTGDEPPPPVTVETLPSLPVAPLSPEEEAAASRRRVWKIVGISVGVVVGLVAYTALMTFLALLAAGMRV